MLCGISMMDFYKIRLDKWIERRSFLVYCLVQVDFLTPPPPSPPFQKTKQNNPLVLASPSNVCFGDVLCVCVVTVRAGSVIFLVGVGSLVCWKLWEHWRSGAGSPSIAPPTPSTSPAPRRPRGLLATLLEEDLVQDLDDYDDEDPAFIHVSIPCCFTCP